MKTIIFDFDGTLLNSNFRHKKLLYDVLKLSSPKVIYTDLTDYLPYKREGNSTLEYLKRKFINLEINKINNEWIDNIENKYYLKYDTLYKDTLFCLEELRKKYNIILVTARKNEIGLFNQIEKNNLINYFNEIIIVKPGNPKYSKVKKIGFNISYVIGDTENDSELADNLGCIFFALNRGFRSKNFWDHRNVLSFNKLENILSELQ